MPGDNMRLHDEAAPVAEIDARRAAHQVNIMAGPRPMFGDFNDSNVTAGHSDGLLPSDAVHD